MEDAYRGQFHHDWADNKGDAHVAMTFDPPESGCYEIEEYHPGGNSVCAQYLPQNAQLDIHYCKGLAKTFTINQAANPAQWNKIASLMFFKGHKGRLIMRNSGGERCGAIHCFMA